MWTIPGTKPIQEADSWTSAANTRNQSVDCGGEESQLPTIHNQPAKLTTRVSIVDEIAFLYSLTLSRELTAQFSTSANRPYRPL